MPKITYLKQGRVICFLFLKYLKGLSTLVNMDSLFPITTSKK